MSETEQNGFLPNNKMDSYQITTTQKKKEIFINLLFFSKDDVSAVLKVNCNCQAQWLMQTYNNWKKIMNSTHFRGCLIRVSFLNLQQINKPQLRHKTIFV